MMVMMMVMMGMMVMRMGWEWDEGELVAMCLDKQVKTLSLAHRRVPKPVPRRSL